MLAIHRSGPTEPLADSANLSASDFVFQINDNPEPGGFGAGTGAAAVSPAAPLQALYLTEAGDTSAISINDLHQGQIGDCFLISSIGEIAGFHSSFINNMIHANSNGTETVTLYTAKNGALPSWGTTAFKAVSIAVSNVFPTYGVNNAASQDVVRGTKEIWSQVLEKAVATLDGGYGAIANGGNPMIAMEELTGQTATNIAPGTLSATMLQSFVSAGDLLVFDTSSKSGLPYNLVGSHAYMFEKMTTVNGVAAVQLGNPWGMDQPAAIPLSQLSKAFVEIDIGHTA